MSAMCDVRCAMCDVRGDRGSYVPFTADVLIAHRDYGRQTDHRIAQHAFATRLPSEGIPRHPPRFRLRHQILLKLPQLGSLSRALV